MYAVIATGHIQMPPGSVMLIPGSWQDYCQLRDNRGDRISNQPAAAIVD